MLLPPLVPAFICEISSAICVEAGFCAGKVGSQRNLRLSGSDFVEFDPERVFEAQKGFLETSVGWLL
jgi:hypothetical protein